MDLLAQLLGECPFLVGGVQNPALLQHSLPPQQQKKKKNRRFVATTGASAVVPIRAAAPPKPKHTKEGKRRRRRVVVFDDDNEKPLPLLPAAADDAPPATKKAEDEGKEPTSAAAAADAAKTKIPASVPTTAEDMERCLVVAVTRSKAGGVERLLRAWPETRHPAGNLRVPPRRGAGFPWGGWPLLHVAAWQNDATSMRLLLELGGADPDARTEREQTPLHVAALRNAPGAAAVLLRHGADHCAQNPRRGRQTPLHVAAVAGSAAVAKLLLAAGAGVGARAQNGRGPLTPLGIACWQNRADAVAALLAARADPYAEESREHTPLDYAAYRGDAALAKRFLERSPQPSSARLRNALHCASAAGNSRFVEAIAADFPALWAAAREETAALFFGAIRHKRLDYMHSMLALGPPLAEGSRLAIALPWAVAKGDEEIVAAFLVAGTPVLFDSVRAAIRKNRVYALGELLARATEKSVADSTSSALLEIAAHRDFGKETFDSIVRLSADRIIAMSDDNGNTALHLAVQCNNEALLDALLASPDLKPALLNAANKRNATPLHIAASKGHISLVRKLANKGAKIDVKLKRRHGPLTPMDLAKAKGHKMVTELLRERGAIESAQPTAAVHKDSTRFALLPYELQPSSSSSSHEIIAPLVPSLLQGDHDLAALMESSSSRSLLALGSGGDDSSWKTVRVFISSTFLDMNNERDLLAKKVFPELRERCARRKLHLVDVDLRWGVTEAEAENGETTRLCLEAVDEADVFCCMLGQRYGWVPDRVPDDVRVRFQWKDGLSVTAMEVRRATERQRSSGKPHCCFFLRNPEYLKTVPEAKRAQMTEHNSMHALKMNELRVEAASQKAQANYDGPSAKFVEEVSAELWRQICAAFPESAVGTSSSAVTPLEAERRFHEDFMEYRGKNIIGREDILERLKAYAQDENESSLLAVTAAAGAGKSSVMAHFALEYAASHVGTFVLSHFVGASPTSTNPSAMLRRLCGEIIEHYVFQDEEVPEDESQLEDYFLGLLERSSAEHDDLLLVVDAVNQLDESNDSNQMAWLPSKLPNRCHAIISTLHGNCRNVLLGKGATELVVPPLSAKDRSSIVQELLAVHNKRLSEIQLRLLLAKPASESPLYLVLACEELRVFGSFEGLSQKIAGLGDSIPELLDQLLLRLEQDHGKELVALLLSLVRCARHGLFLSDMVACLPCSTIARTALLSSLKLLLRPIGDEAHGLLDFFHQQLAKAVDKRYLSSASASKFSKECHEILAFHFQRLATDSKGSWVAHYPHALSELPFHLVRSGLAKRAEDLLCDLGYIACRCEAGQVYGLLDDFNALPQASQILPNIVAFRSFIVSNAPFLRIRPKIAVQQAACLPAASSSPVIIAAQKALQLTPNAPSVTWLNRRVLRETPVVGLLQGTSDVYNVAVDPASTLLAVAHKIGIVKLWRTSNNAEAATIKPPFPGAGIAYDCTFGPREQRLCVVYGNGACAVFNAASASLIQTLKDTKPHGAALACAWKGDFLAVGYANGAIRLWRHGEKLLPQELSCESQINGLAMTPDGKTLVAALSGRTALVFRLEEDQLFVLSATLKGHTKIVKDCDINDRGTVVATASQDGTARLWNARTGECTAVLKGHSDGVSACCFSPDGNSVATSAYDKTIRFWNVGTGAETTIVQGHSHFCTAVTFSPNGKLLFTGSADHSVRVYKTSGEALKRGSDAAGEHTKFINAIRYDARAEMLVSASWDHLAKVFLRGQNIALPHPKRVNAAAISPDGKYVATGCSDNAARIWADEGGGTWEAVLKLSGHKAPVFGCVFSHDGAFLATGSCDGTVAFWHVATGEMLGPIVAHQKEWVSAITFSSDSTRIFSASTSGTIKVWSTSTTEELGTFSGHTKTVLSLAVSGPFLASGSEDRTARIWDLQTFECLHVLRSHTHEVGGVAFMKHDPRILVTASADKSVRIWDLLSGTELWAFFLPTAPSCVTNYRGLGELAVGDSVGNVHFLRVNNVAPLPVDEFSHFNLRVGLVVSFDEAHRTLEIDIGEARHATGVNFSAGAKGNQLRGRKVVVLCNVDRSKTSPKLLCATAADGAVVPLDPPNTAAAGERVALLGCIMPKPKEVLGNVDALWQTLAPALSASPADGIARLAGIALTTAHGPVCVPSLRKCKITLM